MIRKTAIEAAAHPPVREPGGIIDVEDLSFKYMNGTILSNVNFSVKPGTFTGIIGPNGSGKTTLLKCLVRIFSPEAGRVILGGEDIMHLSVKDIARKVGVVPQKWESKFAFRVADVVLMGRFPHLTKLKHESAEDWTIARDAMELTNTLHLAERPVNEISGGELQRVVIAQVLAQSPEIMLLDEPTSSLDINYQLDICDLLKNLIETQKLTVAAVMHDLNLAARYCDQLILLKDGRIFAAGSVSAVLSERNLAVVYGVKASLREDILTGKPYINIFGKADTHQTHGLACKIHLIGGGGTAAPLLGPLQALGCQLSAGVLNVLDTDWRMAQELGLPLVEEAPFSSISEEAHQANLKVLSDKEIIILCNIPFGSGNLKNLTAAGDALKMGKTLIICDFTPVHERDFTGGGAGEIYNNLLAQACVNNLKVCRRKEEVIEYVGDLVKEKISLLPINQ